jgi:hypothetical protein
MQVQATSGAPGSLHLCSCLFHHLARLIAAPTAPTTATAQPITQCHHQSAAEDQQLITKSQNGPMEVKPMQTTPPHVPVASPTVRKELVECPPVRCMEVSSHEETSDAGYTNAIKQ